MKTVIGSNIFIVKFAYSEEKDIDVRTNQEVIKKVTTCYIKHASTDNNAAPVSIIEDSIKCDSRDKFVKPKGAAITFKRALQKLFEAEPRAKYKLDNSHFPIFINDYKNQCRVGAMFLPKN